MSKSGRLVTALLATTALCVSVDVARLGYAWAADETAVALSTGVELVETSILMHYKRKLEDANFEIARLRQVNYTATNTNVRRLELDNERLEKEWLSADARLTAELIKFESLKQDYEYLKRTAGSSPGAEELKKLREDYQLLEEKQKSLTSQLEAKSPQVAADISRMRTTLGVLASWTEAAEILRERNLDDVDLVDTRDRLEDLIEDKRDNGASDEEYAADLRALATLAEQDLALGEATAREVAGFYKDIVKVAPDDAESWRKLAEYLNEAGRSSQAADAATKAAELADTPRDKAEAALLQARAALEAGDYQAAETALNSALKHRKALSDKKGIGALLNLARTFGMMADLAGQQQKMGDYKRYLGESVTVRREVVKLDPDSISAKLGLAQELQIILRMSAVSVAKDIEVSGDELIQLYRDVLALTDSPGEGLLNAAVQAYDRALIMDAGSGGQMNPLAMMSNMVGGYTEKQRPLAEEQLQLARKLASMQPHAARYKQMISKIEEKLNKETRGGSGENAMQDFQAAMMAKAREQQQLAMARVQAEQSAFQGMSQDQMTATMQKRKDIKAEVKRARNAAMRSSDVYEAVIDDIRRRAGEPMDLEWGLGLADALEKGKTMGAMKMNMKAIVVQYDKAISVLQELKALYPDDARIDIKIQDFQKERLEMAATAEMFK